MFNSGFILKHCFCLDIPTNRQYVARNRDSFPVAGPVQLLNVSERLYLQL